MVGTVSRLEVIFLLGENFDVFVCVVGCFIAVVAGTVSRREVMFLLGESFDVFVGVVGCFIFSAITSSEASVVFSLLTASRVEHFEGEDTAKNTREL